jgi:di/tricarboxylate transporter
MITTCVLSAIMSNAATVAVFLPAVLVLSRRAKISPSRLMMPLGYGAILGGTLTLISTTPNIILGGELERLSGGKHSLGMFEFAIVGIPICVVGIAYMALIGTRLLGRRDADSESERESFLDRVRRRYQIQMGRGIRMAEITLSPHSDFIGRTLTYIGFRSLYGLSVLAIWRRGKPIENDLAEIPLELGDALLSYGPIRSFHKLEESDDLVVLDRQRSTEEVRRAPIALFILAVALVPPVLGWFPLAVSALAAALLMVGTGCVSLRGARRSVD